MSICLAVIVNIFYYKKLSVTDTSTRKANLFQLV